MIQIIDYRARNHTCGDNARCVVCHHQWPCPTQQEKIDEIETITAMTRKERLMYFVHDQNVRARRRRQAEQTRANGFLGVPPRIDPQ